MTDNSNSSEPNEKDFKWKDEHYLCEILKEYHEQSVEDCRIIGNQKYSVLISLSVALASIIYALSEICRSFTDISGSSTTIIEKIGYLFLDKAYMSDNSTLILFLMILALITAFLLFSITVYLTVSGVLFLTFHLPIMTEVSISIEELQRDILFKKMDNIDLFSWNGIFENEITQFKNYLQQFFTYQYIVSIDIINDHAKTGSNQISFNVILQNPIYPIKSVKLGKKKFGTLRLDKEKKFAVLNIEGVELDRLNVNKMDDDNILYESELKNRFRKVMPHFNVYKPSIEAVKITHYIILLLILIFLLISYYILI
jgi:hypothetical protein